MNDCKKRENGKEQASGFRVRKPPPLRTLYRLSLLRFNRFSAASMATAAQSRSVAGGAAGAKHFTLQRR